MKTYESQTALFARSAEKRRSGGAGNGGSHERERERDAAVDDVAFLSNLLHDFFPFCDLSEILLKYLLLLPVFFPPLPSFNMKR